MQHTLPLSDCVVFSISSTGSFARFLPSLGLIFGVRWLVAWGKFRMLFYYRSSYAWKCAVIQLSCSIVFYSALIVLLLIIETFHFHHAFFEEGAPVCVMFLQHGKLKWICLCVLWLSVYYKFGVLLLLFCCCCCFTIISIPFIQHTYSNFSNSNCNRTHLSTFCYCSIAIALTPTTLAISLLFLPPPHLLPVYALTRSRSLSLSSYSYTRFAIYPLHCHSVEGWSA